MAIELTDDGTLDTVLRCTECGQEMRYTYTPDEPTERLSRDRDLTDAGKDYEAFVNWAIDDAQHDHVCEAYDEPSEPEDGDLITTDHETFYQYGRLVLDGRNRTPGIYYAWIGPGKPQERMGPFATVEDALRAYMDRVQFRPNCWFISDHGNAHLMDLTRKDG